MAMYNWFGPSHCVGFDLLCFRARKVPTYSPIDVYIDAFFFAQDYFWQVSWPRPLGHAYPADFGQTLTLVLSGRVGRVVNRRTCVPCFATLRRRQSKDLEDLGVLAFRHTLSIIALRTTKIFCESHSGRASYPDQIDMCPHGVVSPFFFGPFWATIKRIGSATRVACSSVSCGCPAIVNCSGRTCWKVACQKWAIYCHRGSLLLFSAPTEHAILMSCPGEKEGSA